MAATSTSTPAPSAHLPEPTPADPRSALARAYVAGLLHPDQFEAASRFLTLQAATDEASAAALDIVAQRVEQTGCRPYLDQLLSPLYLGSGPGWLDRIIDPSETPDHRDRMVLDAVLKAIDAIGNTPISKSAFDPAEWLSRFESAGGYWLVDGAGKITVGWSVDGKETEAREIYREIEGNEANRQALRDHLASNGPAWGGE